MNVHCNRDLQETLLCIEIFFRNFCVGLTRCYGFLSITIMVCSVGGNLKQYVEIEGK